MPPSSPALEAALVEELAPVGALQPVLARRVAVAAWRLARADRIEAELFEERRIASGGLGLALIRDGNGTRSFETLLRYRGAAMAEFWRALRTLKALQAEQALATARRPRRDDVPVAARGAASARPPSATERTRRRRPAPSGIRPASAPPAPGALHNRPRRRSHEAAASMAAKRTRDWPHSARAVGRPQPNAA